MPPHWLEPSTSDRPLDTEWLSTTRTTKTLRYYEDEGLLHEPRRTANGYRNYSADVLARVEFIRHAQAAGLTLHQIHAVLKIRDDESLPACTSPNASPTSSSACASSVRPVSRYGIPSTWSARPR